MKKTTIVLAHSAATHFREISEKTKEICTAVYSSKKLESGKESFEELYKDMDDSDLIILNASPDGNLWDRIKTYATDIKVKTAYIGTNIAEMINDEETLEMSARLNEYYFYGGIRNYINMLKFAAFLCGDESVKYEEPLPIPWQGIFHPEKPDAEYYNLKDFFKDFPSSDKGNIAVLVSRSSKVNDDLEIEKNVIKEIEVNGLRAIPIYTFSWPEESIGAKGAAWCIKNYLFGENGESLVQGVIKLNNFFLNGRTDKASGELLKKLNCPVAQPVISYNMTIEAWEESKEGADKDMVWGIALPELEGAILPVYIGGKKEKSGDEKKYPVEERIEAFVRRMIKLSTLSRKKNSEKKCVIMLNNNPCASVEASVGGGSKLDALESVAELLKRMKAEGYSVENDPEKGEDLINMILDKKAISDFRWTTVSEIVQKGGTVYRMKKDEYLEYFNDLNTESRERMIKEWGEPPGEEKDGIPPAMIYEDTICITGLVFGNVLVCVQPKRGCAGSRCDGTVCRILHDPDCPPTHQYLASYRYYEHIFGADYLIHMGTHGNLEFLPGKGTGLSEKCFPDICIGNMPLFYIYNADNPPEGTIAKRRAMATIVNHMQTVYTNSGLYDDLEKIDRLIEQYEKVKNTDRTQKIQFEHEIIKNVLASNLKKQLKIEISEKNISDLIKEIHLVLTAIRSTSIQEGLHVFGKNPKGDKLINLLYSILRYEDNDNKGIRRKICELYGFEFERMLQSPDKYFEDAKGTGGLVMERIEEIGHEVVRRLVKGESIDDSIDAAGTYFIKNRNVIAEIQGLKERVTDICARLNGTDEAGSLLAAAEGGFVLPGPSGVVTKGRDDIIPTGRNMYSLDPETIPTKGAWITGCKLAEAVIDKYLSEEGRYPESFGMYWMCRDIMWSGGEGLCQLMYMLGVRPVWLGNGKVRSFEIIPLSELKRPRIDISVKLSGILRDNFSGRIKLLDKAVETISSLDESIEDNYVKKHTIENIKNGISPEDAMVRIFGTKPGTYINGISLQVYASSWKDRSEMADVFTFFNGYAYGRRSYGKESREVLYSNLKNIDITYNKVISDEQDLLGCSCYFGSQGGMTAAARHISGRDVKAYFGDSRESADIRVRTMADELNRVVQSKLFNPKWIEEIKKHGYKGAGDISKRVGRIYGWEATTDEVGDWVFDQITKTYIENEENHEFFKKNNPWALEEMERKLMEAYKRDLWEPAEGMLEAIQSSYLEIEGILEESSGDGESAIQGGNVEISSIHDINTVETGIRKMKQSFQ